MVLLSGGLLGYVFMPPRIVSVLKKRRWASENALGYSQQYYNFPFQHRKRTLFYKQPQSSSFDNNLLMIEFGIPENLSTVPKSSFSHSLRLIRGAVQIGFFDAVGAGDRRSCIG